jgi:D-alanine-D-alanine ligase
MKTRVAVVLGGRSPEHDISVVTGLQALHALDEQRFAAFPVYIALDGSWLVGEALRERKNYLPDASTLRELQRVVLDLSPNVDGRGRLLPTRGSGLFAKPKAVEFDVALFALHGLFGEDGRLQGLFDIANVPYTGMRQLASGIFMDKAATKRILAGMQIPLLPSATLSRPAQGLVPKAAELERSMGGIEFPVVVKPMHLGSSIGVARAANIEELRAALPVIFKLDTEAIVEPFVENLVEYNVSVRNLSGRLLTSAIERPKSTEALLDFKAKYLSTKAGKGGSKQVGSVSQGMLSLTRDINPELPGDMQQSICRWAKQCFSALPPGGVPRVDFLSNSMTGEIWLNEVNPCPGSFGYFLWEASSEPILFSDLLSFLIQEGFAAHRLTQLPADPTHPDARLFERRS